MGNIPPGPLSYFSHWLATQIFWYGGNAGIPRFHRQYPQDFPAKLYWPFRKVAERPLTPLVFAYSPTVLPRPREWGSPNIHIPGYFFLDEPDYQPQGPLVEFLAAGAPPVCVSFGSMIHQDLNKIGRTVLDALNRTGQRGVILTGWGGWRAGDAQGNIFCMEAIPHAWLFPRCSAIVHHGGAGTTAAGLRSGKPNVVIPFAGDQPFWGKRVAALGAGPNPILLKKLDVPALADAIQQSISDSQMRGRAAEVGAQIRAENGVEQTVQLIEEWAARFA
jgi:UDP:flavonoid glycosyltransferase YjiC (YdhE family)